LNVLLDRAVRNKAGEMQKSQWKPLKLNEIYNFAVKYLSQHVTASVSAMHRELYEIYFERIEKARNGSGSKLAFAAPRGHAKSTLTTIILPLWCVIYQKRKFIAIISDTTEQAEEFLEIIKDELLENELLATDFPEACGKGSIWKAGRIISKNRIKIVCWGKGKRLRGARFEHTRPDLIICDDLENDLNIESPRQREKDRKWFNKAVMKLGTQSTVVIVIGTILHYDSLLARLLKQPGWTGRKWKAVIDWSQSPLWEQWERMYSALGPEAEQQADDFFHSHQKEMLRGTKVLWSAVENYYYLMKMRISDGPATFDSEKQNEPVNPDDCLFREEWFHYWDELLSSPEAIYCAVDPSMGKRSARSDPSAIVIGALGPDGQIDILEADIQKRHPDAILDSLLDYHERYQFTRIVIEEVQFQELFKDQVIKEGAKRGLYPPVEGMRPNVDKTLRISKLQSQIKNGIIRFHRSQTMLLDQLKYFPKADHDDGPDALEMLFTSIASARQGPRIRRLG
jgi:predicted phage terminase large subunit-like protein